MSDVFPWTEAGRSPLKAEAEAAAAAITRDRVVPPPTIMSRMGELPPP